jgi:hypothetical protein
MDMTDSQLIQSIMKMQEELVSALAEVNRLTADLVKSQQSTEPVARAPFTPSEEERDNVRRFIFNLQRTGMTNMMGADDYIQKRFGFTKTKSEDYLFDYIDNYSEIEDLYSKPRADVSETSSVSTNGTKKRKGPKPYAEMTPEELAEAKAKAKARADAKIENVRPAVEEPVEEPVVRKKTIIRLKKSDTEPKPKGVLIWNAFMNMVKAEMMQGANGVEPSYADIVKKAQELKEADPVSYKLFTDNWTA